SRRDAAGQRQRRRWGEGYPHYSLPQQPLPGRFRPKLGGHHSSAELGGCSTEADRGPALGLCLGHDISRGLVEDLVYHRRGLVPEAQAVLAQAHAKPEVVPPRECRIESATEQQGRAW